MKSLLKLETDPYRYGEPLGKRSGLELSGFYKLRSGGFRIVCFIN